MTEIIVGGVIKKDNKYLLVQEAQEKCRGKWNIPTGHLDPNESVFDGAKREIYEETGCTVDITGISAINNRVSEENIWMSVIFSTEIKEENIKFDKDEILDVKWFSYDEIINMHDELRKYDWITEAITNIEKNKIADIDLIKIIK